MTTFDKREKYANISNEYSFIFGTTKGNNKEEIEMNRSGCIDTQQRIVVDTNDNNNNNNNNDREIDCSEIQKFLDHSESGAIYVSIGTRLSRQMEYELIETFRNLSQQIVWVYEESDLNNFVPDNVMICPKIPNKIALAHKNTAVFVTEDDTVAVKQALHYGIPMLLVPFRNSELHTIITNTALENMATIRTDEVKKEVLVQKLNKMLQNKNLKAQAKEISTLLHHNSVNLLNAESMRERQITAPTSTLRSRELQRQQSSAHVHLDALGALFFVIFVIVKVSLRFCRFYNSWEWKSDTSTTKKTE